MKRLLVGLLVIAILIVTADDASAQAPTPVGQTKTGNSQNPKQPGVEIKVTLAGKAEGNITKEEFHDAKQLVISAADNDSLWEFKTCEAIIFGKGTPYLNFKLINGIIPHNMDSIINKAPTGIKINFGDLYVMRKSDKLIRPIKEMVFTLVE